MVAVGPKIQQRVAAARSHDTNAQEILGTAPEPALPRGKKRLAVILVIGTVALINLLLN